MIQHLQLPLLKNIAQNFIVITIFPTDIDPATCWEARYYGSSNIFQVKMGPDSQDQAVGWMQHDVNPICICSMEDVPTLTYLNVKMGPMGPMGIDVHLVARSWQGSPERMKSMLLAQWEARENQGISPSIGGANAKNHGKNHCVSCEGFHLATWYTPIQHFIWFYCGVVHVFGAELE
jgi:hypothetical protein